MSRTLHLHVVGVDRRLLIKNCQDCPAYQDPDPRPVYCALVFSSSYPEVSVGGSIPDNCPWLTLKIEELDDDEPSQEGGT